jgi:hypothetical protein
MLQVVQQTRAEKMKMYMKVSKKKLCEMLINCNDILDRERRKTVRAQRPVQQLKWWNLPVL